MKTIREWVWRICGANAQIKYWEGEAVSLSTQVTDLRSLLLQKDGEIEELKAEPAKLKAEVEKCKKECGELMDEKNKAEQKVEELTTRCNQLQGTLDSRDEVHLLEIDKLQAQIEKVESQRNSANGKLGAYIRHSKGYK